MAYLCLIILIFLTLIFYKVKATPYLWIVFLAIISAFNSSCADRNNYLYLYSVIKNKNIEVKLTNEFGYDFVEKFFAKYDLDFYFQLFVIFLIIYFLLYKIACLYTKNSVLFLILYGIFPFAVNAVQIRYVFVTVIVFCALYFLEKPSIKNIIIFLGLIALAQTFHASSLFYFSYLLIFIPYKWVKRIAPLALVFLIWVVRNDQLVDFIKSRIKNWSVMEMYTSWNTNSYWVGVIIILLWLVAAFILVKSSKKTNPFFERWRFVLKINMVSAFIIPFMMFSFQFVRYFRVAALINYVAMINILDAKEQKKKIRLIAILFFLLGYAILFYFEIYLNHLGLLSNNDLIN